MSLFALTLVPADGRDNLTVDSVLEDWNGGKDFIIRDPCSKWSGQDAAIRQVATAVKVSGIGGQAWYFIGKTGTGKTTMAYLLANDFADPMNITEIDSQWVTPKRLREIESEFGQGGLDFGGQNQTYVETANRMRKDHPDLAARLELAEIRWGELALPGEDMTR